MDNANICGPRIKQIREKLGWQQVDLAAALNVDFRIKLEQSDISEIERQVRSVKDYELDAIARVLGVSPMWLLRGDGEPDDRGRQ
jgi:transcriptional regulator with XRE-family HTH domain